MAQSTMELFHYLALDVGQSINHSAAVVWRKRILYDHLEKKFEVKNEVNHIQRWPLSTPYPQVVDESIKIYNHWNMRGNRKDFLIDARGPGQPLIDMINAKDIYTINFFCTGGFNTTEDYNKITLPKKDLIAAGILAFETREVEIGRFPPDSEYLRDELEAFKMKVKQSGDEIYGAAAGEQDDLVIAFSMAAYWSRRDVPRKPWLDSDHSDEDYTRDYDPLHRK